MHMTKRKWLGKMGCIKLGKQLCKYNLHETTVRIQTLKHWHDAHIKINP